MSVDFSGTATLIPDAVYGIRAFNVGRSGALESPLYSFLGGWKAGKNTAQCHHELYISEERRHRVPTNSCTCGFYVYHKPEYNHYSSGSRAVEAIVEGTGKALVGEKGFRVEHLEVKAICMPQHLSPPQKTVNKKRTLNLAGVLFPLLMATAPALFTWSGTQTGTALVIGILLAIMCIVAAGVITFRVFLNSDYAYPTASSYGGEGLSKSDIDKVRKKYPDIQVFDSRSEMIAAFPKLGSAADLIKKKAK